MSILVYMFFVVICFIPFVIISLLFKRKKTKILAILFYMSVILLTYSLICALIYTSGGLDSKKERVLYFENDFLLGTDRISLYKNNTFRIEYGDHLYYGAYEYENNILKLDVHYNFFLPFRSDIPETYRIIDNKISDFKTGSGYFGTCYENKIDQQSSGNQK